VVCIMTFELHLGLLRCSYLRMQAVCMNLTIILSIFVYRISGSSIWKDLVGFGSRCGIFSSRGRQSKHVISL
jgi:hypothetical protein